MLRRTFLSGTATTLAAAFLPRHGRAQSVRAAVVIGVDKAGSLPKLNAAASGATQFADWLEGEGFAVSRFVDGDDRPPVRVNPIFEAIDGIVRQGTVDQLVIYFSGHGFLNSYRELWMLSGAPNNPNQAISLVECERLSKRTGIPNVVFISDACRSTATSLAADSVRGSVIFPAPPGGGAVQTKVDMFMATQEGDPAYEVGVAESTNNHYGIYTQSFLEAFRKPEDDMVTQLGDLEVVLNKDLEGWLSRDVNRRAQLASLTLQQRPETNVLSEQYIGKVNRASTGDEISLPAPEPTIAEATTLAFTSRGFGSLAGTSLSNETAVRESSQTEALNRANGLVQAAEDLSKPMLTPGLTGYPPPAGWGWAYNTTLAVYGAKVAEIYTNRRFATARRVMFAPVEQVDRINIDLRDQQPATVAVRFEDGSGTVVAGLQSYMGTIVVEDGRVVSVTYHRTAEDEDRRVIQLRGLVAASARYGTFRIGGRDSGDRAAALADAIRVAKRVDPALGLYAAYAYSEADLLEQVRSVRSFMRHDINGQIFDVELLADELGGTSPAERDGIAPCCPMLSQGWGLLRISRVSLQRNIEAARDHIEPALWTTFRESGMNLVAEALGREQVR